MMVDGGTVLAQTVTWVMATKRTNVKMALGRIAIAQGLGSLLWAGGLWGPIAPSWAIEPEATQRPQRLAQLPPDTRPVPDLNRDRFPQTGPDPLQPLPDDRPAIDSPNPITPPQTADPNAPRFLVRRIVVEGSTWLSAAELAALTQPSEGRELTLSELQSLADSITQRYLDAGYLTSRAYVPEQTIGPDGIAKIAVIEGYLSDIRIEGTQRLSQNYLRSRIQLGAGRPLNAAHLEDQLRLLKANPLLETIEASLRAGNGPGESVLTVRVTEAKALRGSISTDNYSPPSIGSERGILALQYRNLTGIGDEASFSYSHTWQDGADVLDFGYRLPVNPMEGTIQFRFSPNWNEIVQPQFAELGIRGKSQLYEVTYRQPLVRSPREEFALSLGFSHQRGQTFLFDDVGFPFGIGPDEDGRSITSVLRFGQDYLRRDPNGAWLLRSQFNLGTGLLDATTNGGDDPDGQFLSWNGTVQRIQRLNPTHLLILQADLQLAFDELLASQQFVIGGGQSVRGFRQNVRSGDNGFRLSVEDRITLLRDSSGAPTLTLAPFIDAGYVWNHSTNPNSIPDQRFLIGAGAGLLWEPFTDFLVRLDYGLPLVDLDDRGSNAQDSGVYFSVTYRF
jgi:hemolysin activation/secretion protein